jgi:hypothetical protein
MINAYDPFDAPVELRPLVREESEKWHQWSRLVLAMQPQEEDEWDFNL